MPKKPKTFEEKQKTFQKVKRITAWAGIIVLAALYLSTLVLALIGTETARTLLKFSILSTLVLPVLMYAYILMYRVLKGRGADSAGTSFDSPDSGSGSTDSSFSSPDSSFDSPNSGSGSPETDCNNTETSLNNTKSKPNNSKN